MIRDLVSGWREYARERLSGPLLGPFTVFWLVWNWRLVSVLLFSTLGIELRIQYVDDRYMGLGVLLLAPLISAVVYAIAVPWVNLMIQYVQDAPNVRREKKRLTVDTEILRASIARAEVQANLNQILGQDEVTRSQREQLAALRSEIEVQKSRADSGVALAADLEKKRKEYEALRDKDSAKARSQKEQLDRLREELETKQESARRELERSRKELERKQRELKERLESVAESLPIPSDEVLEELLTMQRWRLFHNPGVGPDRSKIIGFGPEGEILDGRNSNEHRWRVSNGMLELMQKDKKVHSRFRFLPQSRIFVHSGDTDTPSASGQYIVPEVTSP